jgi:hypothetical protein
MSSVQSKTCQFSINIICPKCGTVGVVVWESAAGQTSLVRLSNGFYERLAKKDPYPIELVCHDCGTAQPEQQLGEESRPPHHPNGQERR